MKTHTHVIGYNPLMNGVMLNNGTVIPAETAQRARIPWFPPRSNKEARRRAKTINAYTRRGAVANLDEFHNRRRKHAARRREAEFTALAQRDRVGL